MRHSCRVAVYVVALSVLSACSSSATRRTLVDVPDVAAAASLSAELDGRKDIDAPPGVAWFEVKRGTRRAIISAPHATQPFRNGEYRFSDGGGTAGVASALHSICDVTVIYTTYQSPSDPNYYDDNAFKAALARLIEEGKPALILDVHASHPYRPYDVDIGTMDGRSVLRDRRLVGALIDAFEGAGLDGTSIDWYPGSKNQTMIKYGSARGVPSVQLEFSATRTSADGDFAKHRMAQTIEALADFLDRRHLCTRAVAE